MPSSFLKETMHSQKKGMLCTWEVWVDIIVQFSLFLQTPFGFDILELLFCYCDKLNCRYSQKMADKISCLCL